MSSDRTFLSYIVPCDVAESLAHRGASLWCVAVLTGVNIKLGTDQLSIVAADTQREMMEQHITRLEADPLNDYVYFLLHMEATE